MFETSFIADLWPTLAALLTVVLIDIVLAGDNAVVVGMTAARLPVSEQRRVILIGIALALVFRIVFALLTVQLLEIIGLLLAGGLLLLWVAWKLWRDLRVEQVRTGGRDAVSAARDIAGSTTVSAAVFQIAVADVSMSLDNVLAVAGAAGENMWILCIGLVLSIGLMGVAAVYIANLLQRHRWLAYVGVVLIAYVALSMIWEGGQEVMVAAAEIL
jgi:YjbE family integral membrane protein